MVSRMDRLSSKAVARASALLGLMALAQTAHAQDWDDEVIVDPELAGDSASPQAPPGEEVIMDPELAGESSSAAPSGFSGDYGWGNAYEATASESGGDSELDEDAEYDPLANTGIAKLEVAVQTALDLRHEGDSDPALGLEDAYETRLRFGGEIEFRRSRTLRLVVGSRIDLLWAAPSQRDAYVRAQGQTALDQDRFEVDVIPTAAYMDWTVFPGGHLRIGHQVLSFGRMDFMSNTDALAIYDMRPQPTLNPASVMLAQPAIRFDWDITSAVTLKVAYVPWFTPNLMRPDRDKYKATVLGGAGTASVPEELEGLIDPSFQTQSSQANIRFMGPAPDFSTPQAQMWLGFRSRLAEFGLTAGTALEKIPSYYYTPEVERFLLCDPYLQSNMPNADDPLGSCGGYQATLGGLAFNGLPLLDTEFHRYFLIGLDTAFDIGPLNFAIEGAFSPERHLYASTADGSRLPAPNLAKPLTGYEDAGTLSTCANPGADYESCAGGTNVLNQNIRQGVPVIQGGFHAEYMRGESLVIVGEFFWTQALQLPYDRTRQWLGFKPKLGALYGAAIAASYFSSDGVWRADLSVLTLNGPSIAVMPHIEFRVVEGLYLDAGLQIIEGPNPGYNGQTRLNFGGLFSGQDQVFFGLRWLP